MSAAAGAPREPAGQAEMQAGRVGRAHGLDGSFYVTRALPALLILDASVIVAGRSARIARRAGTDARPIIRVEGIDSRAAAEALRGEDLKVPRGEVPALGEGEWWAHELEGCEVAAGGVVLGKVRRLIELPSCEALEVDRGPGTEDLLIPMVRDAVTRVEIALGRIEVNLEFLDLALPPADPGEQR